MKVKDIVYEDFTNYKLPSMFVGTCGCNWKCCTEQHISIDVCQNQPLSKSPDIMVDNSAVIDKYLENPITQAIVFGGLEPFLQFDELLQFIKQFRERTNDDVVIYTGYYPHELRNQLKLLMEYKNIIVKFGRYKQGGNEKFDDVLGVTLASENQFAVRIS